MKLSRGMLPRIAVSALVLLLIPVAALLARGGGTDAAAVRLSEVLAANSAYPDPTGACRDFIELHNSGGADCDVSGWGLTDSEKTVKYRFPAGTVLPAGGYLAVWCDPDAPRDAGCAGFGVSRSGGETLSLLNRRNTVLDSVETLPAVPDRPMIRTPEGWVQGAFATPGYANDQDGYAAYLASRAAEGAARVRFSELMSANTLYRGPDGDCPDWVELYNAGETAADLGGWGLSDREGREKYIFPAGTVLEPGAYLTVWCGADAGFSLSSRGGETLWLTDPDGRIADRIEPPALERNRAWAFTEGDWAETDAPTPGFPNSEAGYAAYVAYLGWADCPVAVSEVMADNRGCLPDASGAFPDWVELYNGGSNPVDLSGCLLGTDPEAAEGWAIPALTLPPGGAAVVFCDGRGGEFDGELHADFSLSRSGETVVLRSPVGTALSALAFGPLEPDRSAVAWGYDGLPSPGYENSPRGAEDFLQSRETPAPLAINEVMTANDAYLRQPGGAYYDWVELKNTSDAPLDLSGYALSDDAAAPGKFVLPEQTLAPGKTAVVLLTGGAQGRFSLPAAPFALDAAEDWLYLYAPDGSLADFLHVTGHPYRGSVGRVDGERGWFYFAQATPERDNGKGFRDVAPVPEADADPGVYEDVEALSVALTGPGEIRYTTNGSLPTDRSPLYTEPLKLTKTTVLRARCFPEDSLPSPAATFNYVINEGDSLPVVCLSMAPADFDGGGGIYDTPTARFEVAANVAFFEPEGEGFCLDCTAELHGAGSRSHYPKKSMKVNFRPRTGGLLDYDVFGDGNITCFESLLLRGGSLLNGNVLLKDAMIAKIANAASDKVLALNARYANLYVNGRYWGVYCIREAYSQRYGADHLGVPEDAVKVIHGPLIYPVPGAEDLFQNLTAAGQRAVQEDGCAWGESWMDLDYLIDWTIFEAYFTNADIPGNIRYIYNAVDGKWRHALFDLDESLYFFDPSWDYVLSPADEHALLPRAFLKNPEFRDRFLRRLSELLAGPLGTESVTAAMEELFAMLAPDIPKEAERWGGLSAWAGSTRMYLESVRDGRAEKLARELGKYLRLSAEEFDGYFPQFAGEQ